MKLFNLAILTSFLLFSTCTFSDRCKDVTCFNGSCKKGVCECDEGFEGHQCFNEIVPAAVYVDKVVLTSFEPLNRQGEPWDPDGGPDLFICIGSSNVVLFHSEPPIMDADPSMEFTFLIDPPLKIEEDIKDPLDLTIWDFEGTGSSPSIGWQFFTPYPAGEGFPSVLFLDDPESSITAEMHVRYEFP